MAKRTVAQYFDDLDGSPIEPGQTVKFGIGKQAFEIDLSDENASRLRDALAPYIAAGRRISGRSRPRQ